MKCVSDPQAGQLVALYTRFSTSFFATRSFHSFGVSLLSSAGVQIPQ
jgi:hypothetical protein